MEVNPEHSYRWLSRFVIILSVLLGYIGLVWIDKDTHHAADIFNVRVVPALLLYGIPTVFFCFFLFRHYNKTSTWGMSLSKTVLLGIPFSFVVLILFFYGLKYAGIMPVL